MIMKRPKPAKPARPPKQQRQRRGRLLPASVIARPAARLAVVGRAGSIWKLRADEPLAGPGQRRAVTLSGVAARTTPTAATGSTTTWLGSRPTAIRRPSGDRALPLALTLKPGVGLVLERQEHRSADDAVTTDTPGFTAEIRAGDQPARPVRDRAGRRAVDATHDVRSRQRDAEYYVIWITQLVGRRATSTR